MTYPEAIVEATRIASDAYVKVKMLEMGGLYLFLITFSILVGYAIYKSFKS